MDVKLDQVAELAGVAKGTIYLYFRNKEDLFCECLLDDTLELHQRTEQIIAGKEKIPTRLRKLIDLQNEAYSRKGPLIQKLSQSEHAFPLSNEVIRRLHDHLRKVLELNSRLFQEGIESGEFSDHLTASQMAVIFMQIFDLNVKFQLFNVPRLEPEDVFSALMKLFGKEQGVTR